MLDAQSRVRLEPSLSISKMSKTAPLPLSPLGFDLEHSGDTARFCGLAGVAAKTSGDSARTPGSGDGVVSFGCACDFVRWTGGL